MEPENEDHFHWNVNAFLRLVYDELGSVWFTESDVLTQQNVRGIVYTVSAYAQKAQQHEIQEMVQHGSRLQRKAAKSEESEDKSKERVRFQKRSKGQVGAASKNTAEDRLSKANKMMMMKNLARESLADVKKTGTNGEDLEEGIASRMYQLRVMNQKRQLRRLLSEGVTDFSEVQDAAGGLLKRTKLHVAAQVRRTRSTFKDQELNRAELKSLTPKERKRRKALHRQYLVLNEIVETERMFVCDVALCIGKYQGYIKQQNLLPQEDFETIFFGLDMVMQANTNLLKAITSLKNRAPKPSEENPEGYFSIAEPLINLAPALENPYTLYCVNHNNALAVLERSLTKRQAFSAELERIRLETPELKGLNLLSFLVKPVQRLCKYPLLLRELDNATPDDHWDKENIQNAHQVLEDLVTKVNTAQREIEQQEVMRELEMELGLGGEDFILRTGNRVFLRKGTLMKLAKNHSETRPLTLYLFSDLLITACQVQKTTVLGEVKTKTELKSIISLDCLFVKDVPDTAMTQNCILLKRTDYKKTYTLYAADKDEKLGWLNDLMSAVVDYFQRVETTSKEGPAKDVAEGLSKEEIQMKNKLLAVEKKLVGAQTLNLQKRDRKLLFEGPFSEKDRGTVQKGRYMYLFSDILLLCKVLSGGKHQFQYLFPLRSLMITNAANSEVGTNLIHIIICEEASNKIKQYIKLSAPSKADKDQWLSYLSPVVAKVYHSVEQEKLEVVTKEQERKQKSAQRSQKSITSKLKSRNGAPYVGAVQIVPGGAAVAEKFATLKKERDRASKKQVVIDKKGTDKGTLKKEKSDKFGTLSKKEAKDRGKDRAKVRSIFGLKKKSKTDSSKILRGLDSEQTISEPFDFVDASTPFQEALASVRPLGHTEGKAPSFPSSSTAPSSPARSRGAASRNYRSRPLRRRPSSADMTWEKPHAVSNRLAQSQRTDHAFVPTVAELQQPLAQQNKPTPPPRPSRPAPKPVSSSPHRKGPAISSGGRGRGMRGARGGRGTLIIRNHPKANPKLIRPVSYDSYSQRSPNETFRPLPKAPSRKLPPLPGSS